MNEGLESCGEIRTPAGVVLYAREPGAVVLIGTAAAVRAAADVVSRLEPGVRVVARVAKGGLPSPS